MAKINYRWDWEADKPSQIHCGYCGFAQTIAPSATEIKDGFCWHCIKCGSKFTHGDLKPGEPKSVARLQNKSEKQCLGLGYPQTKRLFERKKISEWLILMVGDLLTSQKVSTIATKLKAHYWVRFYRNPTKTNNYNLYSGIELNACIELMYVIDELLTYELQTLHLEKIRREIEVGSLVVGNKGIPREVIKLIDYNLLVFKSNDGLTRSIKRSAIIQVIHADPNKGF